jgi:hypothetical protein
VARDTPQWVTTNTTSKKGLKGRLVVVVTVVGFGLIREWLLLLLQRLIPLPPLKLTMVMAKVSLYLQ